MPSLCQNLKASYEHLQKLTTEFTAKYNAVKDSGDLREVRALRKELEAARDALLEHLALFIVPNAKNPHHQALLEAGLDGTKTKEQQKMRVDIRKEIQKQLAVYREVKDASRSPVLEAWLKDITENEGLIYAEVTKDRAKIVERIKEGMVPVVMPGRAIQERTWEAALTSLQPLWMKGGKNEALKTNYLPGAYKEKMTKTGFFKHIPDQPYLVWVKPTQRVDPGTVSKTFDEQQALYADMAERHPNLYDRIDLILTEYVALQVMFTSRIRDEFRERAGSSSEPKSIRPLDYYDGSATCTFTRFLSAGLFSDRFVPCAYFDPDGRRVGVGGDNLWALGGSGFRPAARS